MTRAQMVTPVARQIAPAKLDVTDRERWLALRREGIGGSDAAAVIGLDKRHTRWQLWLDKTGQLGDGEDLSDDQREWIEFGHAMEDVIAALWKRRNRLPGRMVRCGMLARVDEPWMRVNLDRRITDCGAGDGPCLFEAKNRSAWQAAEWGADADAVPDAPAVQVQWGLAVTGYTHGHLVAAIGGNHLRAYRIDADPELQRTLTEEASWFWHEHVLTGVAPPIDATERTGRILARLWDADPDKVVPANPALVVKVTQLRDRLDELDVAKEDAGALIHELQAAMGEAEVLTDPGTGHPLATWKQNGTFRGKDFARDYPQMAARYERRAVAYDTAKLAESEPDIYRQYRSRSFRLPKERGTTDG